MQFLFKSKSDYSDYLLSLLLSNQLRMKKTDNISPIYLGLELLLNELKVFTIFSQTHYPGDFKHFTYPIMASSAVLKNMESTRTLARDFYILNHFYEATLKEFSVFIGTPIPTIKFDLNQ